MRGALAGLVVALTTATASARPHIDMFDSGIQCERAKQWSRVQTCLRQRLGAPTVLYDLARAKLVRVQLKPARAYAHVLLYIREEGWWRRSSFFSVTNETSDVLGMTELRDGAGYRLDTGTVMHTSVSVDSVTFTRGVIMRKFTHVCRPASACRTVMTACDVVVQGKTYWTFRGTPTWDGSTLRVIGDARSAGRQCMPPSGLHSSEPIGERLE